MKNIQKIMYLLPLLASLAFGACNVQVPTPTGTCGNGTIDAGEQCDLGAQNGQGMGCDMSCMTTGGANTFCGDGLCNGVETNATCASDCPATTSIDAEPNDTMAQALAAATGGTYNGNTLTGADIDYYALSVTTGMSYDIVMSSCTGDPTMTIYNAAGVQLYRNDDFTGLCSGLVGMTFTSAQTVYIVITPFSASNANAGNYTFSITSSAVVTAFCGDGIVNGTEQCDLGAQNGVAGSTCSATCTTVVIPITLTSVTVSPATVAAGGSVTVTVVTNAGQAVAVWDSNWSLYNLVEGTPGTYTGSFFATGSGIVKISEVDVGTTIFTDNLGIYNNWTTGLSTGVITASFTVTAATLTSVTVSPAAVAAGASVTVTVVTAPNQVVAVFDSNWTWHPLVEGVPGTYTGSFFAAGSGIVKISEVDVGTTIFADNLGIYNNWATGVSTGVATPSFTVTAPTLTSVTVSPATVLVGGTVTVTVVTAPNQVVNIWAPAFVTLTEGIAGTYTGLVTASTGGVNTITEVDVGPVWFVDSLGIYSDWNTGVSTGVATASFTVTLPPVLLTETFAAIPANVINDVLYPWVLDATKDAGVLTNSFASGTITHSQSSCYSMTVTGYQGFDFMYQTDTELNWDKLKVSINGGILLTVASGQNLAWTPSIYYSLTGGVDTIQFCYTKDASVSVGLDKVWVDNINFH